MSVLRPGGVLLTEYALKKINVKEGSRLLDAGCGDGTAAAYAKERFGLDVIAIDTDSQAVEKAKAKGLDARVMDAAFLEFDIRTFDTILMECSFTAMEKQEEAIHEAYCVLKNGGNLIISDLLCRDPDMERWEHDYWSAMAQFRKPRVHENCGKEEHIPSPYMQDGGVVLKGLTDLLEELEMEVVLAEDRSEDLKALAAQAVMDYGSIENWLAAEGTWKPDCDFGRNTGYFLLIAHKK